MENLIPLLISFVLLLAGMGFGLPVPVSFFMTTMFLIFATGMNPGFLVTYAASTITNYVIVAVPLFILAGAIMEVGGIGEKLLGLLSGGRLGKKKHGIGTISIVTCAIFGTISGSSNATVTAIGSLVMPKLRKAGYKRGEAASLVANSGMLGQLIPPSALMILFAWCTNQSVMSAFLSSCVAGLILMVFFIIINYFFVKNRDDIVPIAEAEAADPNREPDKKDTLGAILAILMPVIILGGIYGGIVTPVEAAAVSVVYAVPVCWFYYKKLDGPKLKDALLHSGKSIGMIMAMVFAVSMLARTYTMLGLPNLLLTFLLHISDNKYVVLLLINIFLIIIGMLMDDTSAMLLCAPILLPIVTSFGVDPIHFAAIFACNLGLGCITPPTAPVLYLAAAVGKADVKSMFSHTGRQILFGWIPALMIITYFPDITLCLVRLFGYS